MSCILTMHRKKCSNVSPNLILTLLGEQNYNKNNFNIKEKSLTNSETTQNNNKTTQF